jgi:VWFA-related protein
MRLRSKGYRGYTGSKVRLRRRLTFLHFAVVPAVFSPQICTAQAAKTELLVPHKMVRGDFAGWPMIHQDIRFSGGKSRPVVGLDKDQVLVLEDGEEQSPVTLQDGDKASSICLVLDQSDSMKESGKALIAAAKQIIEDAKPIDELALVTFAGQVNLEQDFTRDAGKLEAALQSVKFVGGSSFFDAVWVSIDQLAVRAPEHRKIVVILSDGDDNYSRVQFADLLRKVRYPGAPLIYTLSPPAENRLNARQNPQATLSLEDLTKATGGISYKAQVPDMLKDGAAEISQDMSSRYSLEYTSTHTKRDGRLHKIEVKVRPGVNASKIKTYFRQEYYAPSQ